MINRVIFENKVYYRVADLAELFDVSVYKMRKAIKDQKIKTKNSIFDRTVFVLEENVANIVINNEIAIIETIFDESIEKKMIEKSEDSPVKKSRVKTIKEKSEKKNDEEKVSSDSKIRENERLKNEHALLIKLGKQYGAKLIKAGKMPLVHEISDKHLGKGSVFIDAPLEDIEKMRLIIAELTIENEKLNKVS